MTNIFSIGHSITPIQKFIQKLKEYKIDIVVDARTTPYSHRAGQYNREIFARSLENAGIKYLYRGKNLGGLGKNVQFTETITEICNLSYKKRIVLMCSEGDYRKCHRYITLTPAFETRGKSIEHIMWDKDNKIIQQILFS